MEIEIELRPKSGELRPQHNKPGEPSTRANVLEFDPNQHTLVNIRLETVQYGKYDGKAAVLILLRFIIKFRYGYKRLRSFHVDIEFNEHGTTQNRNSEPPKVISLGPEQQEGKIYTEEWGEPGGKGSQETSQNEGLAGRTEKEHEVKLMGWKRSSNSGTDNVAVWDCVEGRKTAKGVVPGYRAAIIAQYTENTKFQAEFRLDADCGTFNFGSKLFNWLKVFGNRTDDPVIFNPAQPFGKQYPISDFKDLNLNDAIALQQPTPKLPSGNSQEERSPNRTYRVTRIPSTFSREDLQNLLFPDNPNAVRVGSLAATADTIDAKSYQTGTVSFHGVKELFGGTSQDKSSNYNFQQNGIEITLTVDTRFLGLTTLACPKSLSDVTMDIVAVIGLAGNGFGSWKERGGDFMWLRDALPHDIPTARVMTFGYSSRLQGSSSFAGIRDYGKFLLAEIEAARRDPMEIHRPLAFVGHSMGGLIVEEALVDASRGRSSEKNVSSSTIGMLFFGVPHRGLRSEELSSIIRDKPNGLLIESLRPESPYLDSLDRSFAEVASSNQWKIWSYWETQLSNTAREIEGRVRLDGPKAVLVSKGSATAYSPDAMQYPVDRAHSDMVKFEDGCEDYRRVRDSLLDLEKMATELTALGRS